ncbi:unnamed protein product [Vitrella brassicaformis CCMP3155]|uniref:Major facilitator superfamily (MFS) profile domain-containing protein n=1 Tax=Vitrella brassicaformis (strain CCMP3155) TaxID=1169540 RepID=A0A0G4EGG4_VITBC|nr:unnamed protein product [Vitrella brassicaformis CCMP3155]|mmetsp:Transcript_1996/g.4407  ORF Transcript_1996/g.4407 Transcript_1996/m.4407 type:complete len:667 (-) Transcript_1996:239-2239(-)|eukprot:CEL95178.1 unnamed protein product [Vitrella brassicaformis CCMP3155]
MAEHTHYAQADVDVEAARSLTQTAEIDGHGGAAAGAEAALLPKTGNNTNTLRPLSQWRVPGLPNLNLFGRSKGEGEEPKDPQQKSAPSLPTVVRQPQGQPQVEAPRQMSMEGIIEPSAVQPVVTRLPPHPRSPKEFRFAPPRAGGDEGLCSRRVMLVMLVYIVVMLNFDHGAIPACLHFINLEFPLGYVQQSLLGSLVYTGLLIGSPLAGVIYGRFPAKYILIAALATMSLSAFSFAHFTGDFKWMLASRLVAGIGQALPLVYTPVWVDEFAPKASSSSWMSWTQAASVLGSIVGYSIAGSITELQRLPTIGQYITWHTAFYFQAVMIVPAVIGIALMDNNVIDYTLYHSERHRRIPQRAPRADESDDHEVDIEMGNVVDLDECDAGKDRLLIEEPTRPKFSRIRLDSITAQERAEETETFFGFCAKLGEWTLSLISNPLYLCLSLSMASLYFVVTGIQFWTTDYLVNVLQCDRAHVIALYTFTAVTAPLCGVPAGGWISDKLGGYKGEQVNNAFYLGIVWSVVATGCGVLATFAWNLGGFIACLWICLFCGGALTPITFGILVSCVPDYMRSFSSALTQIIYNTLGYFCAPIIPGFVMDYVRHHFPFESPLTWGYRIVLWWSAFGCIFFSLAALVYHVYGNKLRPGQTTTDEYEIKRIRMMTASF